MHVVEEMKMLLWRPEYYHNYVKEGHARSQPNAQKLDKAWVKHWDSCLASKTEALFEKIAEVL